MKREVSPALSNREIVFIVLDLNDEHERQAVLDQACGGDVLRRHEILRLLAARHDRGPNPLDRVTDELGLTKTGGDDSVGAIDCGFPCQPMIGGYRLLKQLGQGGMGTVFLAQQTEPIRRRVALKLIKAGMDSRDVISRFQAERQALAMMDHPNIASVLDAGTTLDGRPYFAMELVEGIPITDFCRQNKLSIDDRLRLLIDVCRAVQHAHQKGIIHRDLKPSNVMTSRHDGVAVVKVIDFGLAKALNQELGERTQFTQFSQLIGTPMYMSPEQTDLRSADIDTRSDVYSLGVLFYELLTESTPFDRAALRKAGIHGIRQIICTQEPPRPSQKVGSSETPQSLSRSMWRELDSISMKVLEKDRNRRYESASAFANDIQRFRNNEPVRACPPSMTYRVKKAAARHFGALLAVMVILAVLVVGTTASLWQAIRASRATRLADLRSHEAQHQRRIAELQSGLARSERDRSVEANARAQTLLYTSDMKLASDAIANQDLPRAAELLDRHISEVSTLDRRGFEWHYYHKRVAGPIHISLDQESWVHDIASSSDGKWLATTASEGIVRVYETETWQVRQTLATETENVNGLDWSHDDNLLAAACSDGSVRAWDVTSGELRIVIDAHRGAANDVVFGPDRSLYSCGDDNLVYAWDIATGIQQRIFTGHQDTVERIALSADGKTLATASSDTTFAIWDAATTRRLQSLGGHNKRVVCVAFSPDGKWVAAGDIFGDLDLADRTAGYRLQSTRQLDGIEALAFAPGSEWLATVNRGGAIQLYPLLASRGQVSLTSGPSLSWMAHDGRAISIAISPDAKRLFSGGRDGRLQVWEPDLEAAEWSISTLPLRDFATGGSDQLFVFGNGIHHWDLDRRRPVDSFGQVDSPWLRASCSADQRHVAAVRKGQLAVFDLVTQAAQRSWPLHQDLVPHQVAISADARFVALADYEDRSAILVFDLEGDQPPQRLPAVQCECLAFSPDSARLAVGHRNELLLYDLRTGDPPRMLTGHTDTLADVAFSPDGRTLATVSHDRLLKLWDSEDGDERYSVVAHRSRIASVDFSPNGRTIATAEAHGVIQLWHADTGQPLGAVTTESTFNGKVRFCGDGQMLANRLADDQVIIYDATENKPRSR